MTVAPAFGYPNTHQMVADVSAGVSIAAHYLTQPPAQCRWSPRVDSSPANPPLSALFVTRPHEINEQISWGRVRGQSGGSAGDDVETLLGRGKHRLFGMGDQ